MKREPLNEVGCILCVSDCILLCYRLVYMDISSIKPKNEKSERGKGEE